MIDISKKSRCCGCSSCVQICPKNCITMEADSEGFLYPKINKEQCVNCHACEKACPMINYEDKRVGTQKAYICQNLNEIIRKDSTSGGIFSAIAEFVISQGGVVFGASFDDKLHVVHTYTEDSTCLSRFRGSKYVQSVIGDNYKVVKDFLDKGKLVCFSGTPCQVEGLKYFVGKEYNNLILIDVVCYAISSPKVWDKYLKYLTLKLGIVVQDIDKLKFRDKTKYGYEYTLLTLYDENGKEFYSSGPESNEFLRGFVSNMYSRPSCHECKFKSEYRMSDFTIWDCYNVYNYDKKMDDNIGTSHVLIHSDKGKQIFEELKPNLVYKEVDAERAIRSEPAITKSSMPNEKRNDFMRDLNILNNQELFIKYMPNTNKVKIEKFLRIFLSKINLYRFVKRMLIKVKGE